MGCKKGLFVFFLLIWFILAPAAGMASIEYDTRSLLIIGGQGETVASVSAKIADHPLLRYRGLSQFDRLDTGTGMWFVYPETDTRTFVMRDMSFPIDIIFVDAEHRITKIHSAPVEDTEPLTPYRGRGKWVLEVPYGWTEKPGISEGDRVLPADSYPLSRDNSE